MRARLRLSPQILVWLAPFVLLAPVWLRGQALYWGTPQTQFVPWWWQAWQTLRQGELPLWNPLLGMGAPLLANYQSGLMYPPHWLYFVLAALGGLPLLAWGQAVLVAAHLALAGLGMQRLLRALGVQQSGQVVAALAFSLSGYLVSRAHFLSINASLAWLPWILLAVYRLAQQPEQRTVLRLAGLLALQWLAGHAQMAWYSLWLAAACLLLWAGPQPGRWRRLGFFVLAGLLALALSAVQWLPTAEYLLHSSRASQVDPATALTYSLWPWRLLTLFAPNLFGNPALGNFSGYGNFWEDALFIGVGPLCLALLALRRAQPRAQAWFWGAVVVASLWLALGVHTPLFPWLFAHVPSFDMFQAPTRFSVWAVFALSVLAGLGVQAWRPPQGRSLYWSRLAVAGALAVILGGLAAEALQRAGQFSFPASYSHAMVWLGVSLLLLSVLQLRAAQLPEPRRNWLLALIVAGELLAAGWGLNPAAPLAVYRAMPLPAAVGAQLQPGRLYLPAEDERRLKFEQLFRFDTFSSAAPEAVRASLLPNTGLLVPIASANNFDPLLPAGYVEWIAALEAAAPSTQAGMLALMNVSMRQHVDADGAVGFEPVPALPRVQAYRCPLPSALAAPVVLPAPACSLEAKLAIVHSSANRVTVHSLASEPGWLLLADTYYPGWVALLDGAPVDISPAYGVFRTVELPAGEHQLEFVYRPLSFYLGLASSSLAGLLCLLLWRRTPR
jgi:hypothetical protein